MTLVKFTKNLKERWVAALKSGNYPQITGQLKRAAQSGEGYCCLGVLVELIIEDLPTEASWVGNDAPWTYETSSIPKIMVKPGYGHIPVELIILPDLVGELPGDLLRAALTTQDRLTQLNDTDRLPFSEIAEFIAEKLPALDD